LDNQVVDVIYNWQTQRQVRAGLFVRRRAPVNNPVVVAILDIGDICTRRLALQSQSSSQAWLRNASAALRFSGEQQMPVWIQSWMQSR
jgi:hypothetical protein